jgi:metallo-beta-lactamase family protein
MPVNIQFLGASGTVTGSKYLITSSKYKLLVDCGIFQGDRNWRDKNWEAPPVNLNEINAVLVTHAHIDHVGMLPRYFAQGLKCPVFMTSPTSILSRILLLDSGRLQEEEAQYRSDRHKSRHESPKPLYTEKDSQGVIPLFKNVQFDKDTEVLPGVNAEWKRMGHLAGAASIKLSIDGKVINFSGDIGRYKVPILKDPEPVNYGDLLLVESTYADRLHGTEDPKAKLAEVIKRAVNRGGVVVIPSFAVGRAQQLLFYIRELKESNSIPNIPVFIDSPMAKEATQVYSQVIDEYDEYARKIYDQGRSPFSFDKLYFTNDRSESIKLNSMEDPMVIISASGMLTGGRILHHLKHRISNPRNIILFVGFQPPGGRGDWIKSGAPSLRLIGDGVPIRAEIEELSMLSAHGDKDELMQWCKSGNGTPGKVAVVHGEPQTAKNFASRLHQELKWNTFAAEYLQKYTV